MPVNCPTCSATMKPLFYMHSLFCPNNCDLRAKAEQKWQKAPNKAYAYLHKMLPPGVPYPEDATRFYLLGPSENEAKKRANILLQTHPCNFGIGFAPNADERKWRNDPGLFQSKEWMLVIKEP